MAGIDTGLGGIWKRKRYTIPALSSLDIHTIPLTSFHTVEYIVSTFNASEEKNKSLTIKAHNNYADIVKSVYGKIGSLKVAFNFSIVSDKMVFTATNNENFEITLEYASLILGKR